MTLVAGLEMVGPISQGMAERENSSALAVVFCVVEKCPMEGEGLEEAQRGSRRRVQGMLSRNILLVAGRI